MSQEQTNTEPQQSPAAEQSSTTGQSATAAQPPVADRRTERSGILRFFREMGSALAMALVAIVYVIQAFQIPTGSMEDSLLVGDFLLGLKFVYGAPLIPFSQELGIKQRFPAVAKPKPGDVVIFKYPGADNKDYIKRMVAGPGDVVQITDNQNLIINGVDTELPPKGKYTGGSRFDPRIVNFAPLRIPAKGDVLMPETMPIREFLFFKNLVHQENPTKSVYMEFTLYVDGKNANSAPLYFNGARVTLDDLQNGKLTYKNEMTNRTETFDFNKFDDWTVLDYFLESIRRSFPGNDVEISKRIILDKTERIEEYTVQFDNYFMVGDNRDNSLDSRYWGYLNYNFVKAKAFILYFSFDRSAPPHKMIRFDRIGKLIRDWNGTSGVNEKIKY
ncbi:MAG: signal peptidase I [Chitinispirillia bacterium]|nr:signal peptidase I [Chitinispirillia bacterium]MCL2268899.1 signal peptidase I [Chitinispirillia bacterium]